MLMRKKNRAETEQRGGEGDHRLIKNDPIVSCPESRSTLKCGNSLISEVNEEVGTEATAARERVKKGSCQGQKKSREKLLLHNENKGKGRGRRVGRTQKKNEET